MEIGEFYRDRKRRFWKVGSGFGKEVGSGFGKAVGSGFGPNPLHGLRSMAVEHVQHIFLFEYWRCFLGVQIRNFIF